ncbi:MAG: GntR family transcriptional regulator [Limnohabitans sp.]|nr:GntR family transcriptional regulator [Limnohabitans sp.]
MLYRQVKRQLINDIQSGSAAPGAALPNEKDLAQRFQVSVGTVRRAVDELVAEHVLLRQQGRGTFVGKLDRERFMFQFFKIVPRDGSSEFPEVRLHKFSKSRATQVEAQALGLHGNQLVFRIENVLHLQGKPVIHDKIAIAESMFSGLNQTAFTARTTTIYGYYQSAFGVTIVEADERLRAEMVLPDSARLLNLEGAAPVLRIDRVAYTFDRKPAEFRTSFVDTQNFDYVSRMRETT